MSLILTAAAIAVVAFIPGREAGDYSKKKEASIARLEKVDEAMKSFMVAHGRRPCPARGDDDTDDPNFGIEAANPGTCVGGTPAAPLGPDVASGYVVTGRIPTKTLNIPDEMGFDYWGRSFTYAVDVRATKRADCVNLQGIGSQHGLGSVTIRDSGGGVSDYTMYSYISHGPDGHGGWPEQGSSLANRLNSGSTDSSTLDNASVDGNFGIAYDNVFIKKPKTRTFDDVVYYNDSLKNTCCIGSVCTDTMGFRIDDVLANNQGVDDNAGVAIAAGNGILVVGVRDSTSWDGKVKAGSVYIVTPSAFGTFPSTLYDPLVKRVDGEDAGDEFGAAVAVGDVDGDNIDDVIVGAPFHEHDYLCHTAIGSVYVLTGVSSLRTSGPPAGLTHAATPSATIARIDGIFEQITQPGALAVGNVNGIGPKDVIIGWPSGEMVVAMFGQADWSPVTDFWEFGYFNSGTYPKGFLITPPAPGTLVGSAVAAGDINGDGRKDIIIGYGNTQTIVRVVFGKTTDTPVTLSSATSYQVDSIPQAFAGSVYSLASGNIDGDTNGANPIEDIIIGDNNINGGNGGAYVVLGDTGHDPNESIGIPALNGTNGFVINASSTNTAGTSVASGDVNGDGLGDIIIGDPANTNGNTYVVFGHADPLAHFGSSYNVSSLDGTTGFTLDGPNAASEMGMCVTSADLTGDGLAEVFAGAPLFNAIPTNSGAVYGVNGLATGWPSNIDMGAIP